MKNKPNLKTSGQRLKYIRSLLKISQKKMSNIMDISQGTLSQIENDHYSLSLDSLKLLQEKYLVNCIWIISGDGNIFLNEELVGQKTCIDESQVDSINTMNRPKNKFSDIKDDIPLIGEDVEETYIGNFGSLEYLKSLENYRIPGFDSNTPSRIIKVEGNNMYPTFQPGDYLVCNYCEKPFNFESGDLVLVILEEGFHIRRMYVSKDDASYYILKNDNPSYDSSFIKKTDIVELYKVKCRITTNLHQGVNLKAKKISKLEHDIEFLKVQINQLMNMLK